VRTRTVVLAVKVAGPRAIVAASSGHRSRRWTTSSPNPFHAGVHPSRSDTLADQLDPAQPRDEEVGGVRTTKWKGTSVLLHS
jgi:hypothetical protein